MSKTVIWHNPRCSKSCQTLDLLRENGIKPEVLLYKEIPPSIGEIRTVLKELGIPPLALIRRNDASFKTLGLGDDTPADELIDAMAKHPEIIERPVVRHGNQAALGRPPESVLKLFG